MVINNRFDQLKHSNDFSPPSMLNQLKTFVKGIIFLDKNDDAPVGLLKYQENITFTKKPLVLKQQLKQTYTEPVVAKKSNQKKTTKSKQTKSRSKNK